MQCKPAFRIFWCTALFSHMKQHAADSLVRLLCRLILGKCPHPESTIPTVSRLSHRDFPNTPELNNKLCTSGTYMLQILGELLQGKFVWRFAYFLHILDILVHLKLSRSCDCHKGAWQSILQLLLSSHGWNRVAERQLVSPNYCSAFFLLIPYRADTVSHPEIACAKCMCSRTAG